MKSLLICLVITLSSNILRAEGKFKNTIYTFIKSDLVYSELMKNFCFHPNYVYVREDDDKKIVSTVASFKKDGLATVNWSNFIEFTLVKDKITAVKIRGLGHSIPCFQPKYVVSIGNQSLEKHEIKYPNIELNLQKAMETLKKEIK